MRLAAEARSNQTELKWSGEPELLTLVSPEAFRTSQKPRPHFRLKNRQVITAYLLARIRQLTKLQNEPPFPLSDRKHSIETDNRFQS